MALSDVSLRRKAMSGLGATADIGRRYGLDGSVAFDPKRSRVAWSYVPKIARLDHNSQALGAGGIGSGG